MLAKLLTWFASAFIDLCITFWVKGSYGNQIWLYKSISSSLHGRSSTQKTRKNRIYNIHMYKYIMYTHSETYSQEKRKSTVTESSLNCFIPVNSCWPFHRRLTEKDAATPPAVMTDRVASRWARTFLSWQAAL